MADVCRVPVSSFVLVVVLGLVGCGSGDGGTALLGDQPRTLPDGAACTPSSGGDQEPREFDATALVLGPAAQPGRSVELTVCFVPPTEGRAVASIAVEGGVGGVVPTPPTVDFPAVRAGERQVGTVSITVADGGRGTVRTTIQIMDAGGEPVGRYIDSTYVLGGPDAVFVSEESLGSLDQVALEHERDAGRISDDEYRRRVDELRQPGQLSPAS